MGAAGKRLLQNLGTPPPLAERARVQALRPPPRPHLRASCCCCSSSLTALPGGDAAALCISAASMREQGTRQTRTDDQQAQESLKTRVGMGKGESQRSWGRAL